MMRRGKVFLIKLNISLVVSVVVREEIGVVMVINGKWVGWYFLIIG